MILYQRKYEMTGIIVLTYVHTNLYTRDTFVNKSSWKNLKSWLFESGNIAASDIWYTLGCIFAFPWNA